MLTITDNLCDIYSRIIREQNADNDKLITFEYEYDYYYHSKRMGSCSLQNITSTQVYYCAKGKYIDVSDLKLTGEDLEFYRSCLLYARYDFGVALDLFIAHLYQKEDKPYLKNLIITSYRGERVLFDDQEVIQELELTENEQHYITSIMLGQSYLVIRLLTNKEKFKCLTDVHKDAIISLLRLDKNRAINYLGDVGIPLDFRLRIFHSLFTTVDYLDVFNGIYSCRNYDDEIRSIIFNYLIQNDNIVYLTFEGFIDFLSDQEKALVCNKFYKDIFGEFRTSLKYKSFLEKCIIYGKWLRKSERQLLIKRINTRTRAKNINIIKQKIKFAEDELAQLNSIELAYKLT